MATFNSNITKIMNEVVAGKQTTFVESLIDETKFAIKEFFGDKWEIVYGIASADIIKAIHEMAGKVIDKIREHKLSGNELKVELEICKLEYVHGIRSELHNMKFNG